MFACVHGKCIHSGVVSISSLSQPFWIHSMMTYLKARCTWLASWQGQWQRWVRGQVGGLPNLWHHLSSFLKYVPILFYYNAYIITYYCANIIIKLIKEALFDAATCLKFHPSSDQVCVFLSSQDCERIRMPVHGCVYMWVRACIYTTLVVPAILCHTHMVDCARQWVQHLIMLTITQTHPNRNCSGACTRLPSGNLADSVVCH